MSRSSIAAAVIVACLAIAGHAASPRAAFPAPCASVDTLGLDPGAADTTLLAFHCRGWGEVFLASDTLIQSITVWRPSPPETLIYSVQLFITEVDSASEAPRTNRILLNGPSLVSYTGDGVHPVPYRFVLDPPFALPYRGKFFFAVVAEDFGYVDFLATRANLYTDGMAWSTGPSLNCTPLGARLENPAWDLIFRIEFCAPEPLAAPSPGAGLFLAAYPNPSSGQLTVSFSLPSVAPATLDVLDLSGRRIHHEAVGAPSPGLNTLLLPLKARLRPGLYFIRLDQAPRRLFTKICVLP